MSLRQIVDTYHLLILKQEESSWKVNVIPFTKAQEEIAQTMYATLESQVKQEHDVDIVLVSVGDMKAIKKAYPNYFWTQINLLKKCRVRSKIYLGFDKIKLNHPRVVLLGQNGTTIRHQKPF
ncbi:hypothetical protein BANRA_00013 [Acinetobacter baumannii]|nr:hypothetical protein BANRA_00013 [Acinetobacter baumannii]